ncbi:MAG: hypothetical protein ACRDGA_10555, partial [Bacteroidota bacterium]
IREIDDSLRLHPSWKPMDDKDVRRIRKLEESKENHELMAKQGLELASLKREARVRRLAEVAHKDREDQELAYLKLEAEIERLKDRIRDLGGDMPEADK